MRFRELIQLCSFDEVCRKLYRRHHRSEKTVDPVKLDKLNRAYGNAVRNLLALPKTKPAYPIAIHRVYEPSDKKGKRSAYHTCSFANPNYTPPPRGKKPWHGKSDDKDDHPKGSYNASFDGHQKYFGMDLAPWEDLVDAKVLCPKNLTAETVVANILWEITFFGFDNAKAIGEMSKLAEKALEETERGNGVPMDILLKHPKADWKTLRRLTVEEEKREAKKRRSAKADPASAKGSEISAGTNADRKQTNKR